MVAMPHDSSSSLPFRYRQKKRAGNISGHPRETNAAFPASAFSCVGKTPASTPPRRASAREGSTRSRKTILVTLPQRENRLAADASPCKYGPSLPDFFSVGLAQFPNPRLPDRECAKEKSQLSAGLPCW
jgi:hypothetical protein